MSISEELNLDDKISLLKETLAINGSAIQSADSKASVIITSISLIAGFYIAFVIGPAISNTSFTSEQIQALEQIGVLFWSIQLSFGLAVLFCLSFAVWTIWPRLNIRDDNPLNAPQITFFHYIAGDPPRKRWQKFLELVENFFPLIRGRNQNVNQGKLAYQSKINALDKQSVFNEYSDQIWEIAQIAERKMWLIRGATIWFFISIVLFIFSLTLIIQI